MLRTYKAVKFYSRLGMYKYIRYDSKVQKNATIWHNIKHKTDETLTSKNLSSDCRFTLSYAASTYG